MILEYSMADIEDGDCDSVCQLTGVPVLLMPGSVHLIDNSSSSSNAGYVLTQQERSMLVSQPANLLQNAHLDSELWNRLVTSSSMYISGMV